MRTAVGGVKRLAGLSPEDKQACLDAFRFFQGMQDGEETATEDETKAVADYYKVLNNMLSIFDLEKLYIPPQLDESQGLYGNQLLVEQAVLNALALEDPAGSHLLDMGCGRGRISHYFASLTGGQVSGYNIDPNQIENATDWAAECDMSDRLHFKRGNHHEPLEVRRRDLRRVLLVPGGLALLQEGGTGLPRERDVPGPEARRALLLLRVPAHAPLRLDDAEHVTLHKSFLPTLAATHSMYPADVCAALERAGFEIVVSAPSKAVAWPICEQKRDLILLGRKVVRALEAVKVLPPWVEESLELLQSGGESWTTAEKAKIADLNWRIVATKPA